MTLVRYIPITLEGDKIVYNKDLELLESSLEYEETFEEKFGTKNCNEWKDLKVKQKSNQEDTCEYRREKSLNDLKHIWSEASDLDSFPVTSTPVIDKFDSALKSVTDSCPTSIFPMNFSLEGLIVDHRKSIHRQATEVHFFMSPGVDRLSV